MDVFISYNWGNAELVHKLCDRLEKEENLKLWVDRNKMQPGDDIYSEMEKGIRQSNVIVAFITKKYCESANCQLEIKFANQQKGSKCLYVMLEKGLEKEDLNGIGLLIAANYRINAYKEDGCLTNWSEDLYRTLVTAIQAKLNGKPIATADSTQEGDDVSSLLYLFCFLINSKSFEVIKLQF